MAHVSHYFVLLFLLLYWEMKMCMKNGFPRHECQGHGLPTNLGHATCHTAIGSFTNGWTHRFNSVHETKNWKTTQAAQNQLKFPTPLLSYFSTWRFQRLAAGNCRRKQSWIHVITWFNLTSELYFHRFFITDENKSPPPHPLLMIVITFPCAKKN